jgi:hypothetical protein
LVEDYGRFSTERCPNTDCIGRNFTDSLLAESNHRHKDADGISLGFGLDGPVVFAIGPFVIQEANQPFPQMLHRGGQLAVGPGHGSPVEFELDEVKCAVSVTPRTCG